MLKKIDEREKDKPLVFLCPKRPTEKISPQKIGEKDTGKRKRYVRKRFEAEKDMKKILEKDSRPITIYLFDKQTFKKIGCARAHFRQVQDAPARIMRTHEARQTVRRSDRLRRWRFCGCFGGSFLVIAN